MGRHLSNKVRCTFSDGNSGFLRAARAGNLEKVLEYLRSSIDINTSNANGLNALHLASKEGHVNIVQELLSRGANVNAATKKGNTALHIASLAGQEEVVKLLVKHNANINCQSQNGFSPLYMAAQENHIEVVKFLLANGANQSLATEDGFTPLAVSLQQGHEKVVAILLENDSKGSKVRLPALHIAAKKNDTKAAALLLQGDNQPDLNYKSGFTPLHIAAHYGNLEVAQLLISRGADVNYAASQNITPLHVASKWGKENIVQLLLEKGAQIDVKTKDGLTPLHCAARSGHDQVVDLLLENGAPFGAKTKNGLSALHMAAQGDHVDAARILLYYKSTLVDDVSSDYLSPLHVASHCGNFNVAKLLCERRADVNAKALNGFSCLHIACKKNRLKLVELLISNGADLEAKTESGLTCLHVASFVGSHDIVVYLLQHGANINATTIRGETPLHLATRNNQVEIVQTLLHYGASVDMKAKEAQTCLHLATRLGNIDIVNLLLKANANVDNTTKDGYSSLHIAAKEGHEEIASLLIDHGANLNLFTKRNFSALHICSKYGNIKVANLLLQKGAKPDCQGKNDLTPLHCAVHYNHGNIALLLLQHAASPHVTARNGYTPLHIAAKKNTHDIAEMLLEYNSNTNAQSTGGFTPLHLSCQDGHSDMTHLLLAHHANPNIASKCHLTPLHLCAQEDRVKCAEALVNKNTDIDAQTLSGYTSLHVACHFGQLNMVRYLLQLGANVNIETNLLFTPLHSAAQQGHVMIVKLLLENGASPNKTNKHGMTALSIAQRLGYISVVEELKVVTETTVTSKHELLSEERYKIQAPEISHEEQPLTDSDDEGDMLGDASSNVHMQYLREGVLMTEAEENKLNQVSLIKEESEYPILATKDGWNESRDNLHDHQQTPIKIPQTYTADNEIITKPRHGGFLVSFLVDARGGAMRGCRHSGVRVIIPAKRASMPTRITCRFVKRDKLTVPPPLNEGDALAARILEVGPVNCKFLGPVILEIPHFASLRNREREIVVLRSDNGEKWTEHASPTTDEAVRDALGDTIDSEELENLEELNSRRITRIITNDFPRFFALITRLRQEANFIDEQGGLLTSTIIPKVQALIPEKALQKRIRISLHVLPISSQLLQRSYGTHVNVSPIVTVEPRRRKFHKPITLTIPLPTKSLSITKQGHQRETQQHGNAYTSDSQTLRLLCSITGGTHPAQFDDITGHTPLTFSNECATFTTTVSARFWLVDAQGVPDVLKLAHEIYREAISVPYMSRFVVFAKRNDPNESLVRVFCITDDKENKTLEMQEHFIEIAKSKEVEVINGNAIYLDLQSNNLQTIVKTNEQLTFTFRAFRENRLPCIVRIRDQQQEPTGRLIFSKDNGKLTTLQQTTSVTMTNGHVPSNTIIDPQLLQPICNLNIILPSYDRDLIENEERIRALHSAERDSRLESWRSDDMYRKGEIRLTDIARLLGTDWPALAAELELTEEEVTKLMDEYGENAALHMLRYWLKSRGTEATGNCLQLALRKIGKENIVHNCVFNIEWVTDAAEKEVAKARITSRGGSVDGTTIAGRRLDEGFESDDEYERRRHGRSNIIINDANRTRTIIKTITFEESIEDELGEKKQEKLSSQQNLNPQFKQLEPLKMIKRDLSKEFLPSSSSTSSADTIINAKTHEKRLGERDAPLHYVDSSKAPTPASRYGGYYSIYHPQNYSGSITPLSCYSHPFEMIHIESLREKLNRLTRDKVDHDDSLGKQRSIDLGEGRKTPTEYPTKKFLPKRDDFGIVHIAKETTPIELDNEIPSKQTSSIIDTIVQETPVSPIKLDSNKLEEDLSPSQQQQSTILTTEQPPQILDDISPTRTNLPSQTVPPVGERLVKSKIIPEQARALAHALKHAVVKPLKKTIATKKMKSLEINTNESQITHSLSNPSSMVIENSDNIVNETYVDSLESISPLTLTPPPAKPPRHNDESGSSSSIDISSPPIKPPRHFSLSSNNNNNNDDGLIQQTDNVVKKVLNLVDTFGIISDDDHDMNILRQKSSSETYVQQPSNTIEFENENLNNFHSINTFTVDPARIILNTDSSLIIKSFDEPSTTISSFHIVSSSYDNQTPIEITQLANHLTENLFEEIEKEFQRQDQLKNLKTIINDDRQYLIDKLSTESSKSTNNTFRDNVPLLPQSLATTHPASIQSTTRPLMFVSLEPSFNITKTFSPLLDIVTTKPTPKITTSVTVISPPQPEISSTITANINSDDEEQLNSSSTLMPNSSIASDRSKFLLTSSKESSIDSNDTNLSDNAISQQLNTGSATPARSLLSDYDNLHGSYGSLNDDTQQPSLSLPPVASTSSEITPSMPTITNTTATTSISTINESFESIPSSTGTYATAMSTLTNDSTSGSTVQSQQINSYISDEDLVESYEVETPILTPLNPFRFSKASPPIIEVVEDNSEPADEDDMSFLNDILEQYNHNLYLQDTLAKEISDTEQISTDANKEVTLAGKGEEPSPPPSSSSSKKSSLLFSSTSPSTNFPSFSSSHMTTITESNISPSMTSQSSILPYQQSNDIQLKKSIIHEDKKILDEQHHTNINLQSLTQQRRLPLPNKLTFEQNITNLIENESPLLQSELLTAEHELSVLRSRLAVNEGVTAVTGTILKSLKGQFEPHHKVDIATSPFDISKTNLSQHSLAIQTSPMIETLPDIPESVEIHYDAQTVKSPYLLVKTKNSFWIAQPIPISEAQTHLKKFSSPVMKRATVKLPKAFDQAFLTDSDTDDEQIITSQSLEDKQLNKPIEIDSNISNEVISSSTIIDQSISPLNENLLSSTEKSSEILTENKFDSQISMEDKQPSEIKKIRSSSLLRVEEQFEQFDDKIDEIYSIIDYLKNTKLTSTNFNNIYIKINDLKIIISDINLNKQDELRIEYELDELQNLFHTINDNLVNQLHQQEDYSLIDLFEQNVNELRRIINDIKSKQSNLITTTKINESEIKTDENLQENLSQEMIHHDLDWTPEQMAEYFQRGPDGQLLSPRQTYSHLIPENPVITRDVFFEGDKSIQEKRSSHPHLTHLIPEDARISADSFYEGDVNRSLYQKEKTKETIVHDKPLIPENPLVSSDVFYEGDSHRSMFTERSSLPQMGSLQPSSIDNLRSIMSDLMLAASWSKRPHKIDEQQIKQDNEEISAESLPKTPVKIDEQQMTNNDEEILAESIIITEQHYPTSNLCEIVHEVEHFPLTSSKQIFDDTTIEIEERDTISPFTSHSPIFIHRTILTRQDTERWPPDETIIIDEHTNEEILKTNELEKITHDIRQHAENSLNLFKQRQEIDQQQYQLPQIIDQQSIIDDNLYDESKKQKEEEKDHIFIEALQQDIQERDENEQYHIEKTWSTDKITEPPSTILTDEDAQVFHEPLDEYKQEQQLNELYNAKQQDLHERTFTDDETFIIRRPNIDEVKPAEEYEYRLESKLASQQLPTDYTRLIEHEEQPLSPTQTPIEDKHELERRLSFEKRTIESRHLDEQEEDQYEPTYETVEQDRYEPLLTTQPQFIEHPEVAIQQKDESEERLTIDKNIPEISETGKKHEDEEPLELAKIAGETHEPYAYEIEQKPTGPHIQKESPYESDHEEEGEEYQTHRKSSDDQVVLESSRITEEAQYEPSSSFAATPIAFHQEIPEVKHEPEEYYEIKRKLSTDQVIVESPESSEHEEEDQYEPEVITSSDKIRIESTEAAEDNLEESLAAAAPQLIEPVKLDTTYTDEEKDHYETEEKLTTVEKVLESTETVPEEEKRYHEEELLQTEKPAREVHETDEYEIEQKATGTDIRIESPHESDHEEEEEQYKFERKPTDDQVVLQSSPIIEEDQYKASSIFAAVPITFLQEISEAKHEPEIDYHTERKLSSEHVVAESPEISERESEEDQSARELRTGYGRIQLAPAVPFEQELEEPLQTPEKQFVEPAGLVTTYGDEEKDHYESEEKLTTIEKVLESTETVTEEEKRYHDEELLQTEKPAREVHETHKDEFEQKPSGADVRIESPHESDYEEEEEGQYQSERKPTDDQIILQSSPTIQEDQYKASSILAAVPIAFQQEIHEVKHEPEVDYHTERKLSSEHVVAESPEISEHESEEDQSARELRTGYGRIQLAPAVPFEQELEEPLQTSEKQFIEPAELVTIQRDQEKNEYESKEELLSDTNIIETPEIIHEEKRHDDEELLPREKPVSEAHETDEYEIEDKPSGVDIHIESPHESDNEEEEKRYESERKPSDDQAILESSQITEEALYEPSSSFAATRIAFHEEIPEVKHEPEEYYEIKRKLSTEQVIVESPESSEHEEEDQYQQELVRSSDEMKIEPTLPVEKELEERSLTLQQRIIESPEIDTQHMDEEKDHYESEEELSADKNVIKFPETVAEQKQYHDEELLQTEKPAGEVHETDEYEIEHKPTGTDIRIESPHESDYEEEEEEQYQSERKPTDDQVALQFSPTIEEDQYKASSILAAVPIAFHQEIPEVKHEPEEYYEIKRKLSTDQVIVESPESSEHEEEDQYEPEVITSSDKIRIESTEAAEVNLEEPLATAAPQLIERVKLGTTYTDEEKEHYETEEKLTTVEKKLESTETVTEEENR
ncbi:unnamed protein product, partial [Rotaria sp. Silwood2]